MTFVRRAICVTILFDMLHQILKTFMIYSYSYYVNSLLQFYFLKNFLKNYLSLLQSSIVLMYHQLPTLWQNYAAQNNHAMTQSLGRQIWKIYKPLKINLLIVQHTL